MLTSHERKCHVQDSIKNTNCGLLVELHIDRHGLKILTCSPHWNNEALLIRPRLLMIAGGKTLRRRGGEEDGNFWKWLQTHFLVYPVFEKRIEPLFSSTPHRSNTIVSQLLTHQACQLLPEALISPSLIAVAPCSFTFPPLLLQIHFTLSVNNFLGSSVLSLNSSLSTQHSALLWNRGFHL